MSKGVSVLIWDDEMQSTAFKNMFQISTEFGTDTPSSNTCAQGQTVFSEPELCTLLVIPYKQKLLMISKLLTIAALQL